jgi:predicted DNA-binding protein (UPF0251 family)
MPDLQKAVKPSRRKSYTQAMRARDSEDKAKQEKAGITEKGVKKTIWFHEDEAEALRLLAFKERRSESAIVREAVRKLLGIED